MKVQAVPFGVPRPSPTATDVGLRLDSVMLTVPAWATVNVYRFEPVRPNPPENVSVVGVEDVVDGEFKRLLHATLARAKPSARARPTPTRAQGISW